jgi:hypothetical protein
MRSLESRRIKSENFVEEIKVLVEELTPQNMAVSLVKLKTLVTNIGESGLREDKERLLNYIIERLKFSSSGYKTKVWGFLLRELFPYLDESERQFLLGTLSQIYKKDKEFMTRFQEEFEVSGETELVLNEKLNFISEFLPLLSSDEFQLLDEDVLDDLIDYVYRFYIEENSTMSITPEGIEKLGAIFKFLSPTQQIKTISILLSIYFWAENDMKVTLYDSLRSFFEKNVGVLNSEGKDFLYEKVVSALQFVNKRDREIAIAIAKLLIPLIDDSKKKGFLKFLLHLYKE